MHSRELAADREEMWATEHLAQGGQWSDCRWVGGFSAGDGILVSLIIGVLAKPLHIRKVIAYLLLFFIYLRAWCTYRWVLTLT